LKDQETKEVTLAVKIVGSFLVILSGLILFTDKVTDFHFENNFGFKSTKTFIWVLCQSISPFLLAFAPVFKPFRTSYLVPIYIYTIQIYWVFKPSVKFDDYYLQTYAVGACVLFLLFTYVLSRAKILHDQRAIETKQFIKEQRESLELLRQNIINTGA
jgi:hypothetical protein